MHIIYSQAFESGSTLLCSVSRADAFHQIIMFCRCFLGVIYFGGEGDVVCLHRKKINSNLYRKYLSSFCVGGKNLDTMFHKSNNKTITSTDLTRAYNRLDMYKMIKWPLVFVADHSGGTDFGKILRIYLPFNVYLADCMRWY